MKQYLSLLKSKTAMDALIVLGGSGISSALGFIFVFLIARNLGPERFGIFSTIIGFTTFLSAVADLGINQSLVAFISGFKTRMRKKTWSSTSLASVFASSIAIALVMSCLYRFFLIKLWGHNQDFSGLVFLIIIIITVNIFLLALLQSLQRFWSRSILDNVFSVMRLVVIGVFFLLYARLNIALALWSIVIAYLVAFVAGKLMVGDYLQIQRVKTRLIPKLLGFSKWLAAQNFFANLYGRLDVMMLPWLSTLYFTGIYAAAARFMSIFPLVVSSLSSVVSPRFASFTTKDQAGTYFRKSLLIGFGISAIMLLLLVLAYPIIFIAYGEDFLGAIAVFRFLVLANIPLLLSIPATNAVVYFYKKPKYVTGISLIQLFGLVLLNLWLIPKYGMFGPAYSLLAMNSLGMIGNYLAYFWLHKDL